MGVKYEHLIQENCAPAEASHIGIYNDQNERVGQINLSNSLKPSLGNKLYSFGALSDVHLTSVNDKNEVSEQWTAIPDLTTALKYFFKTEQVDFVCVSGDLGYKGIRDELQIYKNTIDNIKSQLKTELELSEWTKPIYVSPGNHENYGDISGEYLHEYVDLPDTANNPLYYSFEYQGDVFIMFGVQRITKGTALNQEQLQWLYDTLELNRNKRVFLFEHIPFEEGCGDILNVYNASCFTTDNQYQIETAFCDLLSHYKNVIFFHGHTHMQFELQQRGANANYDNIFGIHSIHIPSLSVPRTGETYQGGGLVVDYPDSEGYVVDVYENGIMLKGRDFDENIFLPIATYYLDTTLKHITEHSYVDRSGLINTSDENGIENVAVSYYEGHTINAQTLPDTSGNEYLVPDGVDFGNPSTRNGTNFATSDLITFANGYQYTLQGQNLTGQISGIIDYYNISGGYIKSQELWSSRDKSELRSVNIPHVLGSTQFRVRHYVAIPDTTFDEQLSKITLIRTVDETKIYTNIPPAIEWTSGVKLDYTVTPGSNVTELSSNLFYASEYIDIDKGYSINTGCMSHPNGGYHLTLLYYDKDKKYIGYDYRIMEIKNGDIDYSEWPYVIKIPASTSYVPSKDKTLWTGTTSSHGTVMSTNAKYVRIRYSSTAGDTDKGQEITVRNYMRNLIYLLPIN